MGGTRFLSPKNDLDVECVATALVLAPTLEDAVEILAEQGATVTVDTLRVWRDRDPFVSERYEKRRTELAPQLEPIFANDLLDNARRATLVIRLAIERTKELLEAGEVRDPSRVARDLSQVVAQSIEKRHAIQGRPTQIVEHRDVSEIVRQLVALGVASVAPDAGSLEARD
jgi:hypothetical protein